MSLSNLCPALATLTNAPRYAVCEQLNRYQFCSSPLAERCLTLLESIKTIIAFCLFARGDSLSIGLRPDHLYTTEHRCSLRLGFLDLLLLNVIISGALR